MKAFCGAMNFNSSSDLQQITSIWRLKQTLSEVCITAVSLLGVTVSATNLLHWEVNGPKKLPEIEGFSELWSLIGHTAHHLLCKYRISL